jgi:hypothetical protein
MGSSLGTVIGATDASSTVAVKLREMKSRFLIVVTALFIVGVGYVAYAERYQLAAKLWHWRHGYMITMGNYEVPVPEHWLITDRNFVAFSLMNTASTFPRDAKFHTADEIVVFPFGNRAIGNEGLDVWLSLRRQWFERERVKSVVEKKLTIGDAEAFCFGGSDLKDLIVGHGHPEFDTDVISLECRSTDDLSILFVGEPSDVQPFYTFVSQIRRLPARAN